MAATLTLRMLTLPRLPDHSWYRLLVLGSFPPQVGPVDVVPVVRCYGSVSLPTSLRLLSMLLTPSRVTFQWMFWGYSLAYSRTASAFIGNMDNFGLKNVMSAPSPGSAFLPEIVFCEQHTLDNGRDVHC
jgi:hypothetical protein